MYKRQTLLFLDGSHENYDLLKQYPTEERFGGQVQALGGNVYHVCRGSVLELENKKSVSYTHLDVYKRQVQRQHAGNLRDSALGDIGIFQAVGKEHHCLLYTSRCV